MEDVIAEHFEKLADYRSFALVFPVEPTFIKERHDWHEEGERGFWEPINLLDRTILCQYLDDTNHWQRQLVFNENNEGYYVERRTDGRQKVGRKVEEGYFKGGIREGYFVSYHYCGRKKKEGYYQNGKKVGFWTRWNDKGEKECDVKYFYP